MLGRLLLLWPAVLAGQGALPTIIGLPIPMLPPAVDATGFRIVFGSAVAPDGTTFAATDLYLATADGAAVRRLTRFASDIQPPTGATGVSLAADGSHAAFAALTPGRIGASGEVHLLDLATGADRTVAVDAGGCIQPLCANCFFPCVDTPHVSPDGSKVLYSVRRQQPFYIVNADGAGLTHLPVFNGELAAGPQRVISRNGLIVFTSSAPSGPTFAATATDVYSMKVDGTSLQQVTKLGSDPSVFASAATISADGGAVAFQCNRDPSSGQPTQTSQIWVVRSDGSGLRALTSGSDSSTNPSISADGSLVAFARGGQIYVVHSDGTGLQAVTNFKMSAAQDPVISDDGSTVACSIGPQSGGRGAIYAVRGDGTNLRPAYAPRALNPRGVTGLIGFSAPSPGSLIAAYGLNLGADTLAAASRFPLPGSLGGVSLLANGSIVPLVSVTPWQINAQLPPETPSGPAAFQLRFDDGAQPVPSAADVQAISPAIFSSLPGTTCQAAVLHGGTAVLVDQDHPAGAGETVEIYGTGLGPTNPFVPAGMPAPASPPARSFTPDVLIGSRRADVTFAGLTPGLAGVYQVNAVVPSGLRSGAQTVIWRNGDISSDGCATLWVK